MAITFKKDRAVFTEVAIGDDAETLLEWLQKNPKGKIDLTACTHLHPANLQVLIAAKRAITAKPNDKELADWLSTVLQQTK